MATKEWRQRSQGGTALKVAYVFPGQGAQYVGMGGELADRYEAARKVYALADEALGFSISSLCFDGPAEELKKTHFTQPALLATSIAALRAFEEVTEQPVVPSCVAGHSLGEYTACVAAGALDLREALILVHRRGQWMDEAVPGGTGTMAAILGMEAAVLDSLCKQVSTPDSLVELANVNCPGQIVISGHSEAVKRAMELAKEQGAKRAIALTVSGPFHSSLMKKAADKLGDALETSGFMGASVPIVANVNAGLNTDTNGVRKALREQLYQPVQWELDTRVMLGEGVDTFIEFGPGTVLSGLIRKVEKGISTLHVEDEASLKETLNQIRDKA